MFLQLRGVSLVEASKKGLDSEVKVLLEDGADVNFRNEVSCLGVIFVVQLSCHNKSQVEC